jgi:hypothetical protein
MERDGVWQMVFVLILSGLLAGLDGKGQSVANGICFDSKWSAGRPGWKGAECGKWYLF